MPDPEVTQSDRELAKAIDKWAFSTAGDDPYRPDRIERILRLIASHLSASRSEAKDAHAALAKMPTEPFKSIDSRQLTLAERIDNVRGMWVNDLAENDRLTERLEKAEKVIERLPKTKDGVPVYPGMRVWPLHRMTEDDDGSCIEMNYHVIDPIDGTRLCEQDELLLSACFSTREAALASTGAKT
jgi:hypothetical protein